MGVVVNFIAAPQGNATLLFTGVGFVAVAILIDAIAYGKLEGSKKLSSIPSS